METIAEKLDYINNQKAILVNALSTYDEKYDCWRVSITVDYKTIHVGSFASKEKAIDARLKAEKEYFGEYSYSNSSKLVSNY